MLCKETRDETLRYLFYCYQYEKQQNRTWQREDSAQLNIVRGKILGFLMALDLEYIEKDNEYVIRRRNGRLYMRIPKEADVEHERTS